MSQTPNIDQVINLYYTDQNNNVSLFRMPGSIQCDQLIVGGSKISGDSFELSSGTIGGITLENHEIKSNTLTFDISSSTIDFGGASLLNVGSVTTNPDYYSTIFNTISTGPSQVVPAGQVTLPNNSVSIIKPEFIASRPSGVSACGTGPFKVNYIGGLMTFSQYQTRSITSDDTALDNLTVDLSQSGSNLILSANNNSIYSLEWRVTVSVTILPLP